LVNNAGILRDRMLANMSEEEWDAVIRVHLKGTFLPARHAAAYWRDQSKSRGAPLDARLINTSSSSGLFGNGGQTNYGAAKAGVAVSTITAACELKRSGFTATAVMPHAQTRMTETLRTLTPDNRASPPTASRHVAQTRIYWAFLHPRYCNTCRHVLY